jgi:hypothetical protein
LSEHWVYDGTALPASSTTDEAAEESVSSVVHDHSLPFARADRREPIHSASCTIVRRPLSLPSSLLAMACAIHCLALKSNCPGAAFDV